MNSTPIAVLIDELRHEDQKKRINSIRRLSNIAVAMGPEKTRSDLLVFLEGIIPFVLIYNLSPPPPLLCIELLEDDDEVLAELADVLTGFDEYVGGPNHTVSLFKLFEAMCKVIDSNVREKVALYNNYPP